MQILDLMKQRCSVRQFEDRPVEQEKLLYVLEAARVAPTACNLQPLQFVILRDRQQIARIAPDWVPLSKAPVVIVACGDHQQAWRRRDGKGHADTDVAIAVDHMTLAAAEIGLGTCWICAFDAYRCAQVLDLSSHVEPMVLLPIGYPAEGKSAERHGTERKTLKQLVPRGFE